MSEKCLFSVILQCCSQPVFLPFFFLSSFSEDKIATSLCLSPLLDPMHTQAQTNTQYCTSVGNQSVYCRFSMHMHPLKEQQYWIVFHGCEKAEDGMAEDRYTKPNVLISQLTVQLGRGNHSKHAPSIAVVQNSSPEFNHGLHNVQHGSWETV